MIPAHFAIKMKRGTEIAFRMSGLLLLGPDTIRWEKIQKFLTEGEKESGHMKISLVVSYKLSAQFPKPVNNLY